MGLIEEEMVHFKIPSEVRNLESKIQCVDALFLLREVENYFVVKHKISSLASEIRKYWPNLRENSLLPAYAGIRPKLLGDDYPNMDLRIDFGSDLGGEGLCILAGIESPSVTSCMSIA